MSAPMIVVVKATHKTLWQNGGFFLGVLDVRHRMA